MDRAFGGVTAIITGAHLPPDSGLMAGRNMEG